MRFFALTCHLMPALERAGSSRVVTVASIAHKRGQIRLEDLQSERKYVPMDAYAQSKLADLMFTIELERRLRAANAGVVSIAAHPGVAATNLFQVGEFSAVERMIRRLAGKGIGTFLNTEEEGALPTLFAATSPAAYGGHYYGPQGLKEMRGGDVGEAEISARARDKGMAARLWTACEEMTETTLQRTPASGT